MCEVSDEGEQSASAAQPRLAPETRARKSSYTFAQDERMEFPTSRRLVLTSCIYPCFNGTQGPSLRIAIETPLTASCRHLTGYRSPPVHRLSLCHVGSTFKCTPLKRYRQCSFHQMQPPSALSSQPIVGLISSLITHLPPLYDFRLHNQVSGWASTTKMSGMLAARPIDVA